MARVCMCGGRVFVERFVYFFNFEILWGIFEIVGSVRALRLDRLGDVGLEWELRELCVPECVCELHGGEARCKRANDE